MINRTIGQGKFMRLFIAVTFDDTVKDRLAEMQDKLRVDALHANFTEYENLHMTLHFFGERFDNRLSAIKKMMDGITEPAFPIQIQGAGCFKHDRGGDLWWAGVRNPKCMNRLHSAVCEGILRAELYHDYERQDFKFRPHITLAREVLTHQNFDPVIFNRGLKAINTRVEKIVLMNSERIGGVLVYTPVHEKKLAKG